MKKPILMIAEKPSVAKRLAVALSDSPIQTKKVSRAAYYIITHNSKKIIIAPAVGHLFTLAQKTRTSNYPVFDLVWKPTYEKGITFTKPYFDNFKRLSKITGEVIIATDNDSEGSTLGWNIAHLICGVEDGRRMLFSTLTTPDLQKSFKTVRPHFDFPQIEAGITRHNLDFIYGISLTKAASAAILGAMHRYQTLSIGRVQGPTLSILAEREKEILAFKPEPYWQIFIRIKKLQAVHVNGRFFEEPKEIFNKIKDKPAQVKSLEKKQYQQLPPTPFDLTTLQTEAFRCFKLSPKMTLAIAQELYTAALISYPRTSSQKLPPTIGYRAILNKLSKQPAFTKLISGLSLRPRQGAKTDPAHPAIFPTGEFPKSLNKQQLAVYNLIVKRFLACFGEIALKEITQVIFDVEGEDFVLKGQRTVKQGWKEQYAPYSKEKELELPEIKKGEIYSQKSVLDQKETSPPDRYSQASIIKKLEKDNLGTKATRAAIVDILYQRGYVRGQPIEVTKLGLQIIDTFSKYAPEILSKELTGKFEMAMEKIRENKLKPSDVLNEVKKVITKICLEFDKNIIPIGESLAKAFTETQKEQNVFCICPACKKGEIRMITSKKTGKSFAACSEYPDCRNTYPLPQHAKIYKTKLKCKECGFPIIKIVRYKRRAYNMCLNHKCKSKEEWGGK